MPNDPLGLGAGYGAGAGANTLQDLLARKFEETLKTQQMQAQLEQAAEEKRRFNVQQTRVQQGQDFEMASAARKAAVENATMLQGAPLVDLPGGPIGMTAQAGLPASVARDLPGATVKTPVSPLRKDVTPIHIPGLGATPGIDVTPQSKESIDDDARRKVAETPYTLNVGDIRYQGGQPIASGRAPNPPAVPREPMGSDYAQFLKRFAAEKGKTTDQLTAQDEIAARKAYGQADDQPRSQPVLRIQTVDANGNPITQVVGRDEARGQSYAAAPTTDQRNREAASGRSKGVLNAIAELSEKINTGKGVVAKAAGEAAKVAATINLNDDVSEYEAVVSGFTPLLARAVGHTGVLTEQDVQSVRKMLPAPEDSKSVRDRKINRIQSLMGDIGGGKKDETLPPTGKPSAADLIKKYGGGD